jgi:tight adherence protein B
VSDVRLDADLRSVDLTVATATLTPGAGLDPASVNVAVDGRELPATALVAESDTTVEAPRVLLVVDTSGSMLGQPMTEAKQAISAFVADSAPGVELGLLHFSTSPQVLVPPTTDRSRLLGAIATLTAQGETALYDAIVTGVAALGAEGDRRLVVLSDGGDTRSTGSLSQVLEATSASGVVVDAIGFNTDESVADVLAQITTSGRGQVHRAESAAQLSSALTTAVRRHARVLTVNVLIPEDLRGERVLDVRVASPAGVLSASTPVSIGAETAGEAAPAGWWGTREALIAGLGAIGASLLVGSLALLGGGRRDQRKVQSVLERFTTAPIADKPDLRNSSPVTRTALGMADRIATSRNLQDRLSLRLERAAIAMTPAEWLLLRQAPRSA